MEGLGHYDLCLLDISDFATAYEHGARLPVPSIDLQLGLFGAQDEGSPTAGSFISSRKSIIYGPRGTSSISIGAEDLRLG